MVPIPWKPSVEGEVPTLGYVAIDWITEYLAAPDKPDYEPFILYREQEDFVLRWYAIDPETGRWMYRRGLLGRPRGWGKSPLLAALSCVEALAPIVPAGWDADGQPVGRPWADIRTPNVHIAAVSEEQTKNTWDPLLEMLREGPVIDEYRGVEPLDTMVNLPKGKILQRTASARTIKGAKPVFSVLDQALALDTPIPTPDGWRTMGDLESGDFVFGSRGPVRISQAKPASVDHDCYRVTFSDGTAVVASAGHLWMSRRIGWPVGYHRVRTTTEMRDGYRYRIPAAVPQPLPEADLPAHPYLLGVWLGDGTRGKCEISVQESDLADLQANLAAVGVQSWPRRYGAGAAVNLSFTRARGFGMVDRPEPAKAIQSLPCYLDKHIPEQYFTSSIEQRTMLLRGLMDSDGHVTQTGTCLFVNTNPPLAVGVVRLLRSLGQTTSGARFTADERYSGGGVYRVGFTPRGGLMPFAMDRKAARVRQHRRSPEWVTIVSIEPVERVAVRCIAVESDDHLFAAGVAGHLTHNTEEWVPSNGGVRLAGVMRANAAKIGGRTLESPNAYIPGEQSVAEDSAAFAASIREGRARDEGLLYDHREAPAETDLTDRDSLSEGLRVSYGDSCAHPDGCVLHVPPCPPGHVEIEPLISAIWDPAQDVQMSRSDFLNQITHASDSWVSRQEWLACMDLDRALSPGDVITLGFDGSRGRNRGNADATALVGCRVSDGYLFSLSSWVWEPPTGPAGRDWVPNPVEVDAEVRRAFELWDVVGFAADPNGWTEQVARWEASFGRRLKVKAAPGSSIAAWPRGKDTKVVEYVERFRQAVVSCEVAHDGSSALTRHVLNARRRAHRQGYLIFKAYPDSPNKIDAAYAGVMAWKSRLDAIAAGAGERKRTGRATFV